MNGAIRVKLRTEAVTDNSDVHGQPGSTSQGQRGRMRMDLLKSDRHPRYASIRDCEDPCECESVRDGFKISTRIGL
jgi:hypothetical protein